MSAAALVVIEADAHCRMGGEADRVGIQVEWSNPESCSTGATRSGFRIRLLLDQVKTMATVTIEVPDGEQGRTEFEKVQAGS